MSVLGICFRCGRAALELLRTHSHCWECGFFPEADHHLSRWRNLEYRTRRVHDPLSELLSEESRSANHSLARLSREGIA